ncbi:MAG: nicotinamide mononucleotide transporter [Clostridia bacterium]|nr:nicotinamide mononucleotide transporter [Clostridia bacterium]
MVKKLINYFSPVERILWCASTLIILVAFFAFDRLNYLALSASLIGTASLIFSAKGNPIGQLLMLVFSVIYGIISYSFAYYGEMITYLGMTAPMALFALISWLRNPYEKGRAEVRVNRVKSAEMTFMLALSVIVTAAFYFVLDYFNTANIALSTLSVTTSFVAVYLTFRRSHLFALAYAMNDLVLIGLWSIASVQDNSYISVLVCFVTFFVNDMYGFFSWLSMRKRQEKSRE